MNFITALEQNWAPITGQVCKSRLSQPNFFAILGKMYWHTCTKSSNVTHANLGLSLAVFRLAGPRVVAKGIKLMSLTTVLNEFQHTFGAETGPQLLGKCVKIDSASRISLQFWGRSTGTHVRGRAMSHMPTWVKALLFQVGWLRMVAKGVKRTNFTTVLSEFQHSFGAKTGPQLLGKCVKIGSPSRISLQF